MVRSNKQSSGTITCDSVIGVPSERKLIVAIGPLNQFTYQTDSYTQ